MPPAVNRPAPEPVPGPLHRLTLGLVHIGPMELAIPVDCLREAIDEPRRLSRLPTPSPHVAGGIDVRQELITGLDLRSVLNLPPAEAGDERRVIILHHKGYVFGLRVDRLGEVVQVSPEHCLPVEVLRPDGPPLVREVFSLDDGRRVISGLCLDGVMQLSQVPLTRVADRQAELALRRVHQQWSPYLMFEVGQTRLCLHADLVDTVIHLDSMGTRFSPARGCIGVVEDDSRKLAVLDVLDLLGLGHTALRDNRQVLVLKVQGRMAGLLVRQVSRIARQDDRTLRPVPPMAFEHPELFMGMLPVDSLGEFLKIDGEALVALQAVTSMAMVHGSPTLAARQDQRALAEVFLTYQVGTELASPLRSIREILPFPERFTPMDRAGDARVGLLNHRDQVVAIFSLAMLCGLPRPARSDDTRLLLLEGPRGLLALEVERVLGIEAAQWRHPALRRDLSRQPSALQQALHARGLLTLGPPEQPRGVQALDLSQVVAALVPAPPMPPVPEAQAETSAATQST